MILDGIWWVVLITALALWFVQNIQHEGMHALAARHWGAKITKFRPWPVNEEDKFSLLVWKKGHSWARLRWEDGEYDTTGRGLIDIAPQFAATVTLCFIIGVRWRFPDMPPVVASILAGWYVTNAVDCGYCIGGLFRKRPENPCSDAWKFVTRMGFSDAAARTAMIAWYLWFGFHLFIPTWLVH